MNFFSFFDYLNREVFTQDASYLPDTQKICSFSHLYGQNTEMIYTNLVKKEINIYFPLRNGSKDNLSQAAQFIKNNWTTCEDELLQIYETDDLNIAFEAKGNCIKPKQIISFKAKQESS